MSILCKYYIVYLNKFKLKNILHCNSFFQFFIGINIKKAKKIKKGNSLLISLIFILRFFSKVNYFYYKLILAVIFFYWLVFALLISFEAHILIICSLLLLLWIKLLE